MAYPLRLVRSGISMDLNVFKYLAMSHNSWKSILKIANQNNWPYRHAATPRTSSLEYFCFFFLRRKIVTDTISTAIGPRLPSENVRRFSCRTPNGNCFDSVIRLTKANERIKKKILLSVFNGHNAIHYAVCANRGLANRIMRVCTSTLSRIYFYTHTSPGRIDQIFWLLSSPSPSKRNDARERKKWKGKWIEWEKKSK